MEKRLGAANSPEAVEIAPGVHWIGVMDPDLRTFDIILKTANGTTYNAYAVRGKNGVAIVDTVKANFSEEYFRRIESIAKYEEITTIVLNHLEPDHSGALPELLKRAPNAKVYISGRGRPMLKGLLQGESLEFTAIHTGDCVDLGDRKLTFYQTPFLHWPDTMCTWLDDVGVLFSGDAFGCHYCDPRLFNDLVGDFRFSFDYYYAHIMRPFRAHVIEALDLISPLPVKLVAPSHGPILRDNPTHYMAHYRELATPRLANETGEDKTLLIFYVSAYGSTRAMAERIAIGAEAVGGVRVSMYDIEGGEVAPFVNLVEEADCLVVGSPTINGDAVKPMWDLLSSFATIQVRGKLGAAFGSYGWTGEAVALMEDRLRGLKLELPHKGARAKLIPSATELDSCEAMGKILAMHLTGQIAEEETALSSLG